MTKKKFHGIKSVFNLISYGLEVEFFLPDGNGWSKDSSGFVCRDFASNSTGEMVWSLLLQISNQNWNGCIKTIEKIKKLEGVR